MSEDMIFKEVLKSLGVKASIFLAGLLVGTFFGNVWFHLQMGRL